MDLHSMRRDFVIWGFALGYFLTYIPYSAPTRALSLGTPLGVDGPVPGLLLLPATAVATSVTLLLFLTLGGCWRRLERRAVLGHAVPVVRVQTFVSGLATATIIATTTLSYTFAGISI